MHAAALLISSMGHPINTLITLILIVCPCWSSLLFCRVQPTAESLSVLVVQSVHSGDKAMLEEVLQESSDRIVNGTVRNLPPTAVVPFLKTVGCY